MPVNIDHVVENWQSLSFHSPLQKKVQEEPDEWKVFQILALFRFQSIRCVCFSFHLLPHKWFAKQVYCNNITLRICFCCGFFTTSIYLFTSFFLNGFKLEACFLVLL